MHNPQKKMRQMPESQLPKFVLTMYSAENAIIFKRIRDSNLLPSRQFPF